MKAPEQEQVSLWSFWLMLLNVGALYLGSLPLLLWMAPPDPMTYLIAPVAFALVLGSGIGVLVVIVVLIAAFLLAFWLGERRDWWAVPIGFFAVSLVHAFVAINALGAFIT